VQLARIPGGVYRRCKNGVRRLPGGNWLMNWTDPLHLARKLLLKSVSQHVSQARGTVLDIGAGAGPYKSLFKDVTRYVTVDLNRHSKIDVQANAVALPFKNESFDTILCTEVLEHVPEPSQLISEVRRILKPDGILLLTTPQTWGLHLEPLDFYRYTKYGLRYLTEKNKLEVVQIDPTCGMWATLSQRFTDTIIFNYAAGKPSWLIEILSILTAPVLLSGYALDRIFGKRGDTLDYVLVAKKVAP
jgi:SAM-dependent methyltransferase